MSGCGLPLPVDMERYLSIAPDGTLVWTVTPDDVVVCTHCPNLHVRVLSDVSPARLREYARAIVGLAYAVEQRR